MDGCTLYSEKKKKEVGCGPTPQTGAAPSSPPYGSRRRRPGPLLTPLLLLLLGGLLGGVVQAETWASVDGNSNELRVVEYCETEIFHAECPDGQVIVMKSASYGRMKFGRCVDRDYGYVGCSTDVLKITDKLCSGRPKCDVPVPNSSFRRTQPCPKDLKPYFEAEYTCVTVEDGGQAPCEEGRPILLTHSGGYLAKAVAELTGHGSARCPWLIEARPGQTIAITLFDFSLSDWPNTNGVGNGGVCHVTAVIRETTDTRGIRVCGGDGRERDVYTTVTNAVEVRMRGPQSRSTEGGHYLLKYTVHGCPDPEPPANAWLKRRGDKALLGCESLDIKWQLECKGNQWEGEVVGNCTAPTSGIALGEVVLGSLLMPFGKSQVSLIIITAIAVAIGIIILSIGLICLRWRINKRQCTRQQAQKQPAVPQTNTYDGKSRRGGGRGGPGHQDGFPPPPPPEVDNEMLIQNETENEYAYIADMPPPPPPQAGGSAGNLSDNSGEAGVAAGGSQETSRPQVFHDFYPTTPTPYEQSPVPSPYHTRQPSTGGGPGTIAPKLGAHECALAAMGDCSSPHYGHHHLGASPGGAQRTSRRLSSRSRLGSAGDPPTYFELEPEDEVFSFVMHMPSAGGPLGHEGLGGMKGNPQPPHTPPPPPTPPVAPPTFFVNKATMNHNGHIHHPLSHPMHHHSPHHHHQNNNTNNNSISPNHHHLSQNPGQAQAMGSGGRGPRVGPKTAPKPKRHNNANHASNRTSMPLQFTNGNVEDGSGQGQNTL